MGILLVIIFCIQMAYNAYRENKIYSKYRISIQRIFAFVYDMRRLAVGYAFLTSRNEEVIQFVPEIRRIDINELTQKQIKSLIIYSISLYIELERKYDFIKNRLGHTCLNGDDFKIMSTLAQGLFKDKTAYSLSDSDEEMLDKIIRLYEIEKG